LAEHPRETHGHRTNLQDLQRNKKEEDAVTVNNNMRPAELLRKYLESPAVPTCSERW